MVLANKKAKRSNTHLAIFYIFVGHPFFSLISRVRLVRRSFLSCIWINLVIVRIIIFILVRRIIRKQWTAPLVLVHHVSRALQIRRFYRSSIVVIALVKVESFTVSLSHFAIQYIIQLIKTYNHI